MRIIAGRFRSRPLRAPSGGSTRPTSDRVREAIFGMLGARIDFAGANVLDLYAGTGALGLEALSRGANRATFVESDRKACVILNANIRALDVADQCRVVALPVNRALKPLAGETYDLVFADPPYAAVGQGDVVRDLNAMIAERIVEPTAIVVLEHAKSDAAPRIEGLNCFDERVYGDTQVSLYECA